MELRDSKWAFLDQELENWPEMSSGWRGDTDADLAVVFIGSQAGCATGVLGSSLLIQLCIDGR